MMTLVYRGVEKKVETTVLGLGIIPNIRGSHGKQEKEVYGGLWDAWFGTRTYMEVPF